MPRLRRIKDYEVDWNVDQMEENSEDVVGEPSRVENPFESASGDRSSGQSWLSNASVIAVLSDDKLRSAIRYHREMAKLLEEELVGRIKGDRKRLLVHSKEGYRYSGANASDPSPHIHHKKPHRVIRFAKAIAQALDAGLTLEEIHSLLTQAKE